MTLIESRELEPLLLDVSTTRLHVNNEQFEQLCLANSNLHLELSPSGELIVMPPTFASSGGRNFRLIGQFTIN
jgi:Uma2 family endonuclease